MIFSLRSSLVLTLLHVLLCSSFLLAANVEVGDSQAVVQGKLGKPTGTSSAENQATFFYKNGTVEFVDDRAVAVCLLTDEQVADQSADRERLAKQAAALLQLKEAQRREEEAQRQEEERNLVVLNRAREEQRQKEHTRQCTQSVLLCIEDYVRAERLTDVQAEELRAAFIENVHSRKIVAPEVDVWFADPIGRRPGGRDSTTGSQRAFTDDDVQEPIVQCFLVAVRQFHARLTAARTHQARIDALALLKQVHEKKLASERQEQEWRLANEQRARDAQLARQQQAKDIAERIRQQDLANKLDNLNSSLENIHRTQKHGY